VKKALLSEVIEVQTDVPEVGGLLETFFQAFPPGQGAPTLVYTIRASNGKLWVLEGNGKAEVPLFCGDSPVEIVYLIESFFYNNILPSVNEWLLLHAAVLAKGGRALLLLGPSGSGKSLLTTALLEGTGGFSYLSDDMAPLFVDPGCGQCRVAPFPRAIRLREWVPLPFSLPPNQCLSLSSQSQALCFYFPVQRFATAESPVSLLLFLECNPSRLELLRLKKGEAALYLTALTLNKSGYLMDGGLRFIARVAQEVPTYRLLWNEPFRAVETIEKLFLELK